MGWLNINGNWIGRNRGGGISWQTYWTSHFPSELRASAYSDTEIDLSWTNNGTANYTGHKIYISTDGTTYTLKATIASIGTTYRVNGLVKDTLYYFYIKAYSGSSESSASNVTNEYAGLWYLAGGVTTDDIVGAYKFVGRGLTEANSLKNIVNPGTNDLTKVGSPVFTNSNGWIGFTTTDYIDGPIYKTRGYSFLISFRNDVQTSYGRLFSAENDTSGTHGTYCLPRYNNLAYMMQGDDYVTFANRSNGVLGANQSNVFQDGVEGEAITPSGTDYQINCRIGYCSAGGAIGFVNNANVTGLIILNNSISSAKMIALSTRMKNENFINNSLYDYTKLVRYAGNPIILHNTTEWNAYAVDTPYLREFQKIGDYYHSITQVAATAGDWNQLAVYRSLNLLVWEPLNIVLEEPSAGWDKSYIVHPSIILIGSTYYMYYSAQDVGLIPKIGLATSSDMITWTRYGVDPIYTPPAGNAYSPCVFKIGLTYYLYYADTTSIKQIKYATSPDGITWTYGGVCLDKAQLSDFDYFSGNGRYMDPWVIYNQAGFYEMFFSGVDPVGKTQTIGYAFSYDGINWMKHESLILQADGVGWEDSYLGDPCMFELDSKRYLFYVGVSGGWPGTSFDGGVAILG